MVEEIDKLIILQFLRTSKGSLHAHFPIEAITRGFPGHLRGLVKKRVKKLVKLGFLIAHPTSGGITYQFSREGAKYAISLRE